MSVDANVVIPLRTAPGHTRGAAIAIDNAVTKDAATPPENNAHPILVNAST